MLQHRSSLSNYLADLQAGGRLSFTSEEAIAALGIKRRSFLKSAERLQKDGLLLNPRHGFYVAVPPQYRSWAAPPPSWYIDDPHASRKSGPTMSGYSRPPNCTARTHHAVMEFQIVTDKQLPKLRAGRSIIAFYYRKDIASLSAHLSAHKTDTGSMKISSPELTAFDLLRYAHVVGGIDAIATVLSDLKEKLDGEKLASLAPQMERVYTQRMGYLLERLGRADVAAPLHDFLALKPLPWSELQSRARARDVPGPEPVEKNERWRVIVHHFPEIDE